MERLAKRGRSKIVLDDDASCGPQLASDIARSEAGIGK
jgi:hypothetical protein